MKKENQDKQIYDQLVKIISETNGITLIDTFKLLTSSKDPANLAIRENIDDFTERLTLFRNDQTSIERLLEHPIANAFFSFFKNFPLPYHEEHIHLTGSLGASFIYPRLKVLLEGKNKKKYQDKIQEVYGNNAIPINSVEDVDKLIRLQEGELFKTYLKILYLAKIILNSKEAHIEAAYHMASELYHKYNVGNIRLKFTLSRSSGISSEQIPSEKEVTEEDVVLGLYEGFKKFQSENSSFDFILSPSFRKESNFYDQKNYNSKEEHTNAQVKIIIQLIEKYPFLKKHLIEIDTVGDEKEFYRKKHFLEMKPAFRQLQNNGFYIRSHHGETWETLRKGIQAVDNAFNIWHVDTLEHGLSLGINPNFYFHHLYQEIIDLNKKEIPIGKDDRQYAELDEMLIKHENIKKKLFQGIQLNEDEKILFLKAKFHAAKEVEHYQHDVLNHMITRGVSLVALPSSNLKLTRCFPNYKDHPFSWWEKKGVKLGVGTDNYITLNTNYIKEMLILLFSNSDRLKITKLLMVTTKEKRRSYISGLLWKMRKEIA